MNSKIKKKDSSSYELEKLAKNKLETFVKIIETTDVTEKELTNSDNHLYQKLVERSATKKIDINEKSPALIKDYEWMRGSIYDPQSKVSSL